MDRGMVLRLEEGLRGDDGEFLGEEAREGRLPFEGHGQLLRGDRDILELELARGREQLQEDPYQVPVVLSHRRLTPASSG